jgi:hypothetical protein
MLSFPMAFAAGDGKEPGDACPHILMTGGGIMPYYLLLSRSITHAQRMSRTLERAGITARFFRPPMGLTDRGCSYAVRVGEGSLPAALRRLREDGLMPMRVFYTGSDGSFSEITI